MKARKQTEDDTIISSRSQMIEVCSESSFQPLLQLYLFLPTLMVSLGNLSNTFDTNQRASDLFFNVRNLQFWSILTSCLAWSFTFYQSVKKHGALSLGANPMGRLVLLLSNVCQTSTRLIAFVLFAYSCGEGNSWPTILFVVSHIILMSGVHFTVSKDYNDKRVIFQSVLNGICNLYMHNLILPLPGKDKKNKSRGKTLSQTFHRQLIVDSTFLLENLAIVLVVALRIPDIWPLLCMVIGGQVLGLLLKGSYYKFFRIWSAVLTIRNPCGKDVEQVDMKEEKRLDSRLFSNKPKSTFTCVRLLSKLAYEPSNGLHSEADWGG